MKKIVVTGAGSAQSNGVINCLLMGCRENEQVVGLGSKSEELIMCHAHKKFLMPHSRSDHYKKALLAFLENEKPAMIHFQHDLELAIALQFKDKIDATGVKMLVPDYKTIDICVHKFKSWQHFHDAGVPVPNNIVINTRKDLERAFKELGDTNGTIWIRSMSIGGGGKGSLPSNSLAEACDWIDRNNGWGDFIAAEMLTKRTVTWLSIWYNGELVVGQTRRRKAWAHSSLSPSGITGVTQIGETWHDDLVDTVAEQAVRAVSSVPHGIYGVDMAYDSKGVPNPTEINISRFFTTVQFFAEAGLNMPAILKDIVLYNEFPNLSKKNNPLPDGLLWLRAMDSLPMLTTEEQISKELILTYGAERDF